MFSRHRCIIIHSLCIIIQFSLFAGGSALARESALLFRLTGDGPGDGFDADRADGDPEPAYLNEYEIVPDGAKGRAFRAPHSEEKLLTFLAPGNILGQRGTVSFFVRLRDDVGGMPFKLFYVSACDQSSLDMTWLRVDYNGEKGFDAFVTDADMARIRVRHTPERFPAPDAWTHLAFSWDETQGVRLHMNGERVAENDTTGIFDTGLGLFQTFGRFATPGTVTSNCGHLRGGDIDEIHIYSVMLSDDQIRRLAKGETVEDAYTPDRSLGDPLHRADWLHRHGWDHADALPQPLDGASAWRVRKVEPTDARDQKKWTWRATDGIRETVWPDVYNRSALTGRSDYFIEPDWYCYSTSGKTVSWTLPDETVNYIEMTGAAYGSMSYTALDKESREHTGRKLFRRSEGRERTYHKLAEPLRGGTLRYENDVRETPLAEIGFYNIAPGIEPQGLVTLSYTVANADAPGNRSLDELREYFRKRLPADERDFAVALPDRAPRSPKTAVSANPLPIVHVLIPYQFRDEGPRTSSGAYGGFHYTWDGIYAGLDGIAVDLPALNVSPFHDGLIPVNIAIRDPLWPNRALADVSFSLRQGEPKTIFFDTRDRILPRDRSICIDVACASGDFGASSLEGMKVRLIFKKRDDALTEHVTDRFAQVRDNFGANMTETRPQRTKLEHLQRFNRDIGDLFAADPHHYPGRHYWNWWNPEQNTLPVELTKPPAGVPLWAHRQAELLGQWKYYLDWWMENRQIENGEFGGGLSDDGDFSNCMPPVALMGVLTDRITDSIHRLMEAYYENGMFTDGINTILTDALHATEEGINVQPQVMLLEYGDPKIIGRMLETSSRYTDVTGINAAGHRHFPSSFFGASKMATEYPWSWSSRYSHTFLAPGMALVDFNGHPGVFGTVREVGDGILAHAVTDEQGRTTLPGEINFLTDEARSYSTGTASQLFQALARWTGDGRYNRHLGGAARPATTARYDTDRLAVSYEAVIRSNMERMYIATEGFPWDDGPYIGIGGLVEDRLGGAPVRRGNQFPEHVISWRFAEPHDGASIAALVPGPTRESVTVIVYNLQPDPVTAEITGWGVEPGMWEIVEGVDANGDYVPDTGFTKRTAAFERSTGVTFTFPPRQTYAIRMTLKKKGSPYWKRPDLGIASDGAVLDSTRNTVTVTVHNTGSLRTPETTVGIAGLDERVVAATALPAIEPPTDYRLKAATVTVNLPAGTKREGLRAVIDPDRKLTEITRKNNEAAVR